MRRLCFYCFWISEDSRLIRRYVAKEYYALNDEQLASIPFLTSKHTSVRRHDLTLISATTSFQKDGKLEWSCSRNSGPSKGSRHLWKCGPDSACKYIWVRRVTSNTSRGKLSNFRLIHSYSLIHVTFCSQHRRRLQKSTNIGCLWSEATEISSSIYLGILRLFWVHTSQFDTDISSQNEVVTCHLCVLNAHRQHQQGCEISTPSRPRCPCRPRLDYDQYARHDVEAFLSHLQICHLEHYERFRYLRYNMSVPRKSEFDAKKDVWEVQKLIRETYGIGDDLM